MKPPWYFCSPDPLTGNIPEWNGPLGDAWRQAVYAARGEAQRLAEEYRRAGLETAFYALHRLSDWMKADMIPWDPKERRGLE